RPAQGGAARPRARAAVEPRRPVPDGCRVRPGAGPVHRRRARRAGANHGAALRGGHQVRRSAFRVRSRSRRGARCRRRFRRHRGTIDEEVRAARKGLMAPSRGHDERRSRDSCPPFVSTAAALLAAACAAPPAPDPWTLSTIDTLERRHDPAIVEPGGALALLQSPYPAVGAKTGLQQTSQRGLTIFPAFSEGKPAAYMTTETWDN